MLNFVNTTTIEEIELYIEVVRVKAQVNQSVGGHVDLLVHDNYNVPECDCGCGLSSSPVSDTGVFGVDEDCAYEEGIDEYDEDVNDDCVGMKMGFNGLNHVLVGFEAGSGHEMRVQNMNLGLFEYWEQ